MKLNEFLEMIHALVYPVFLQETGRSRRNAVDHTVQVSVSFQFPKGLHLLCDKSTFLGIGELCAETDSFDLDNAILTRNDCTVVKFRFNIHLRQINILWKASALYVPYFFRHNSTLDLTFSFSQLELLMNIDFSLTLDGFIYLVVGQWRSKFEKFMKWWK